MISGFLTPVGCVALVWFGFLYYSPVAQILAAVVDQGCGSISDWDFDSSIINSWLRTVLAYWSGRFLISKLPVWVGEYTILGEFFDLMAMEE